MVCLRMYKNLYGKIMASDEIILTLTIFYKKCMHNKKMIILKVVYLLIIEYSICDDDDTDKITVPLPNFRKLVEEVTPENPLSTKNKDDNQYLVSFLIKNIKEIFGESQEPTVLLDPENDNDETTLPLQQGITTITTKKDDEESFDVLTDTKETNKSSTKSNSVYNASLTFLKTDNITINNTNKNKPEKTELLKLSKDLIILQKAEREERVNQALQFIDSSVFNKSTEKEVGPIRRSCISCDNVAVMECYDPKNKLIPSIVCEREEDLCYSQHTPFGIVDRGCFNVNHNLTTYVCSCNLCNYISISEMPYIFSTTRDWAENVIELSRTRRLRKTIFKDISCLKCEVNTSTTGDMLDNANCLEGNVGTLPIQECAVNEICGVRAIRSEGYIWRGCLSKPLYNYWWTLCDSDLCNYDSLVSIYDEL